MTEQFNYRFLTSNFFRYELDQQIISIYRDRDKIEKVAEFKAAITRGDITIDKVLTKQQFRKLSNIGIKISKEYIPE